MVCQHFNLLAYAFFYLADTPFQVYVLTLLFIIHIFMVLLPFDTRWIFVSLGVGFESCHVIIHLMRIVCINGFGVWLFILLLFRCVWILLGLLWAELPYRFTVASPAMGFKIHALFIFHVDLWELVHTEVSVLTNSSIRKTSFVILIFHLLVILALIVFSWALYCFQRRLLHWRLPPILLVRNTVLFVQLGLRWLVIDPFLKRIHSFLELHCIYLAPRWIMIDLSTVLRGKR